MSKPQQAPSEVITDYKNLFEELAKNHVKLCHIPEKGEETFVVGFDPNEIQRVYRSGLRSSNSGTEKLSILIIDLPFYLPTSECGRPQIKLFCGFHILTFRKPQQDHCEAIQCSSDINLDILKRLTMYGMAGQGLMKNINELSELKARSETFIRYAGIPQEFSGISTKFQINVDCSCEVDTDKWKDKDDLELEYSEYLC